MLDYYYLLSQAKGPKTLIRDLWSSDLESVLLSKKAAGTNDVDNLLFV